MSIGDPSPVVPRMRKLKPLGTPPLMDHKGDSGVRESSLTAPRIPGPFTTPWGDSSEFDNAQPSRKLKGRHIGSSDIYPSRFTSRNASEQRDLNSLMKPDLLEGCEIASPSNKGLTGRLRHPGLPTHIDTPLRSRNSHPSASSTSPRSIYGKTQTAAEETPTQDDEPPLAFVKMGQNPVKESPAIAAATQGNTADFESIRGAYAARVINSADQASQRAILLSKSLGIGSAGDPVANKQGSVKGAFRPPRKRGALKEARKVTFNDKLREHTLQQCGEGEHRMELRGSMGEAPQSPITTFLFFSDPREAANDMSTELPSKEHSDGTEALTSLKEGDDSKSINDGLMKAAEDATTKPQEDGGEAESSEQRDVPGEPTTTAAEHRLTNHRPSARNVLEHYVAEKQRNEREMLKSPEKGDFAGEPKRPTDDRSTEHPLRAQEIVTAGGLAMHPPKLQEIAATSKLTEHSPQAQKIATVGKPTDHPFRAQKEASSDSTVERPLEEQKKYKRIADGSIEYESLSDDSAVELPSQSPRGATLEEQRRKLAKNSSVKRRKHTAGMEMYWEYRVIRNTWRDEEDPPLQHHCGTYFDRDSANQAARDQLFPPGADFDPTLYDEYHKEKDAFDMDIYSAQSIRGHVLVFTDRVLRHKPQADALSEEIKKTWMNPKVYVVWEKYTEYVEQDEDELFDESEAENEVKSVTTTMLGIHTTRNLANKAASDHTLECIRRSTVESNARSEVEIVELEMQSREHLEILEKQNSVYKSEVETVSKSELAVWVDEVDLIGPRN
ncbi:hypothetical protein FGG08_005100 [Glutinoglossum americanum]|uniref:Uncharacterized protein n=1 Tax=Glutinoglossum americanum TaxID=1670608 RepID=A0A9P8I492_9PEZI|nr:hypothetical protein FGG08_005100 [Glutinoglossum americanum]